MTIVFQQITSLSEVDIDGLFEDSFPDLDVNFFDHTTAQTHEEKKAFYFQQLQDAMNGTSYLQREEDTSFFMFKGSIDGVDCVFNAGFIEIGGIYRGHWYLTRPINGNRSWINSEESAIARKQFFNSNGIQAFKAGGAPGSLVHSTIKRNPNLTVVDEKPVNEVSTELTVEV